MITKAIDRLTLDANHIKGSTAQRLAEHLIDHMDDQIAEKVLEDGIDLYGAIKYITDKAKKQAVGGSAACSDEEVFGWLFEYYGIKLKKPPAAASMPVIQTSMTGLHVSLSDLL